MLKVIENYLIRNKIYYKNNYKFLETDRPWNFILSLNDTIIEYSTQCKEEDYKIAKQYNYDLVSLYGINNEEEMIKKLNEIFLYMRTESEICENEIRNGASVITGFSFPCEVCKKSFSDIKKCSACNMIYYCSISCQRKDWPKHKLKCKDDAKFRENFGKMFKMSMPH